MEYDRNALTTLSFMAIGCPSSDTSTATTKTGSKHQSIVTGGGHESMTLEAFTWVNTMIGNVKNAATGTYHAVSEKHLPRYLAEFNYRFNRRDDLAAMLPRLGCVAARTPPVPGRLLKLAGAF